MMYDYEKPRSMRNRGNPESYPHRRRTQSFSSSLLDSIYRSIDESKSNLDDNHELGLSKQSDEQNTETTKKVRMNLRRAVMMEDWIEKQSNNNTLFTNSTTTSISSETTTTTIFSSSETETTTKMKTEHKEKPQKVTTMKQPISPGSRIASFLSSIFNSGNVKKAKMCYVGAVEDVKFDKKSKSPCFSSRRSSLSKTPKGNNNNKNSNRCVRFYPVSVILGCESEKSELCNHNNQNDGGRKLSRGCSMKKVGKEKMNNYRGIFEDEEEDDDDDDDGDLSCSSSDLFELDHLIGGGRYKEELPVYETTDLETNKAIASGSIR